MEQFKTIINRPNIAVIFYNYQQNPPSPPSFRDYLHENVVRYSTSSLQLSRVVIFSRFQIILSLWKSKYGLCMNSVSTSAVILKGSSNTAFYHSLSLNCIITITSIQKSSKSWLLSSSKSSRSSSYIVQSEQRCRQRVNTSLGFLLQLCLCMQAVDKNLLQGVGRGGRRRVMMGDGWGLS